MVGTALQTNFAKRIVDELLQKEAEDVPVIEINLECVLDRGYLAQVPHKSEVALAEMFSCYYAKSKPKPLSKPAP